jgi:hypothetical protein
MGAAKFPEQISERAEEDLQDLAHELHPSVVASKARPVDRKIEPKEHNARRNPNAGGLKKSRKVAKRVAITQELQRLYDKIDRLRASDPSLMANKDSIAEQIALLKRTAQNLQRTIVRLNAGRSKRRK